MIIIALLSLILFGKLMSIMHVICFFAQPLTGCNFYRFQPICCKLGRILGHDLFSGLMLTSSELSISTMT